MRKLIFCWLMLCSSLSLAYPVQSVWKAHAGASARADLQLTPVLYNDLIVTTDSRGYIIANNRNTGRQVWKISAKEGITTGAAINDTAIVVGTHQARVIAFDAKKHHQLWSYSMNSEVLATPAISRNRVAVKTVDGQITVFNLKTGEINWRYNHGSNNEIVLHTSSSPKISNKILVAGFNDGNLFAFNVRNGQLLWQNMIAGARGLSQIDQVVDVTAEPIIQGGIVYVANYQGKIKAIDIHNGQTLWSHHLSTYQPLSIDNDKIYAVDEKGQVLAYDRKHGSVLWRQPKFSGSQLSAPANDQKAVIVGDKSGYLHWLDKRDGHVLTSVRVARSAITSAPLVDKNTLFTVSRYGELSKYKTG